MQNDFIFIRYFRRGKESDISQFITINTLYRSIKFETTIFRKIYLIFFGKPSCADGAEQVL